MKALTNIKDEIGLEHKLVSTTKNSILKLLSTHKESQSYTKKKDEELKTNKKK